MRNKATVRAGIVGSGFAASLHIEAMARVFGTHVDVVGVYSATQANAQKFAKAHDLSVAASLDEVIDKADVVHVCAPPAIHEDVAIQALSRDKFAIVEKAHEFTLVPWRPVIDRQLGREVMGVVQGGSVSWQLGRQRGLGL